MVIGLLVLSTYVAGVVLAIWPSAQWLKRQASSEGRRASQSDHLDWAFGCICGLGWPLLVLAVGAVACSRRIWTGSWTAEKANDNEPVGRT